MDLHLDGSLVLVTASTGGIGKDIAASLAREGARVIVNGRTVETVDEAIDDLRTRVVGGRFERLVADNGTAEGTIETVSRFPEIDILVNNLGVYGAVDFFDITDDAWQRMFEVNVMSGVRLSRHYLAGMLSKNSGRLIFIASEAAVTPSAEMVHYSASKTMVLGVSRGIAELTKGTAVTSNAIVAGPTKTAGAVSFIGQVYSGIPYAEAEAQFMGLGAARGTSLIGRLIEPGEIGSFVAYVSSPLAAAINGAALRIEGGIVRSVF
ncbi:SDR family NAD(P)-dependent oxidoreductase [Subtercola lobariae]|nr:SDR family oxidoreductase [Subtercola lobariae]